MAGKGSSLTTLADKPLKTPWWKKQFLHRRSYVQPCLTFDLHDDPLQRNLQEQNRTTLRQERKMWHRIILHLNSSIIQSILWLLAPRFQYYFYRSFILLYPLRQWHFYSYLANYLSEIRKDELNWNNFQITIMPIIHSLIAPRGDFQEGFATRVIAYFRTIL